MTHFLNLISPPILEAIGAALFHSLWQIALVAGLLWMALRVFQSTNTRYVLCTAALALMALLPIATAVQVYWSMPANSAPDQATQTIGAPLPDTQTTSTEIPNTPIPNTQSPNTQNLSTQYPAHWQPIAVFLWLIGVVFFSIRLAGGLFTVARLKRNGIPIADPAIEILYQALAARMDIARPAKLCSSTQTDQPLLIGWLKPVLLLPASMLTGIHPKHVEAILAHELAHVRRHDYLVSLAQSVVETLFFYHPAVWWVSSRIRIEREYCCDDLAVAVLENKATYVQALAGLEARRVPVLAPSAAGGRLVDRVRRLVGDPRKQNGSWAPILIGLFICTTVFGSCRNSSQDPNGTPEELYELAFEAARDLNFNRAKSLAERSAESGHLCAMHMLAEMYNPETGGQYLDRTTKVRPLEWDGQNESASRYWAETLENALRIEAELGNSNAMVWLSMSYSSKIRGWLDHVQNNEDLAKQWMERAFDAGNAWAIRVRGSQAHSEGRLEEADKLFREAALLGDPLAFPFWAYMHINDPAKFIEIVSLAVDRIPHRTHGWHGWLLEDLNALKTQADKDNSESMKYLAIADSLNLYERINKIPKLPYSEQTFPSSVALCKEQKYWQFGEKFLERIAN